MGRYTTGGVGRDVLAGAVAGAAAVWLINKMDWSLTHAGAKPESGAAPTGMDPAHAAAAKAADAMGADLGDRTNNNLGRTIHYGVGIGLGALYGLLRGMAPSVTTGRGALYGGAAFILGNEVGAPALGLAKGPLDYPARDHARSALAHVVFGVFTDLGTRLLSPWRDEVVILRGPSIAERIEGGKQALADGRDYVRSTGQDYLDRGRAYAEDLTERARDTVDDLDLPGRAERGRKRARKFADDVLSRLPDEDDVSDVVERGRGRLRGYAATAASALPDSDDISSVVERGRGKLRRAWASARERLPDADDVSDAVETGRGRVRRWGRDVADRLPDRDDVQDTIDAGRSRGRKWAKRARERLPDQDDVDDLAEQGRRKVQRLTAQARSAAEEHGGTPVSRALKWLFG